MGFGESYKKIIGDWRVGIVDGRELVPRARGEVS